MRLGHLVFDLCRLLVFLFSLLWSALALLCDYFLVSFLGWFLRWRWETLHVIDVLVYIHLFGLLNVDKELLGMRSDLSSGP